MLDEFVSYYFYYLSFLIEIMIGQLIFTPDIRNLRDGAFFRVPIAFLLNISSTLFCFLTFKFTNFSILLNIFFYVFIFAVTVGSYYFVFNYNLKNVMLNSIMGYFVQHIAYKVNYLIYESYLIIFVYQYIPHYVLLVNFICHLFFYSLVYLFALFILRKFYIRNYQFTLSSIHVITLSGLVLAIAIILNSVWAGNNYWGTYILGIVIALFDIICCALAMYLAIGLFVLSKSKREALKIQHLYEDKIKQYELSKESIDLINIKCHDLRKQIRTLRVHPELIDDEELASIEKAISIFETNFDTGNSTLNVVLSEKSLTAKKYNIELTSLVDSEALTILKPGDIYSLFSNVLDNAIEAVKQVKDIDKRVVSLVVSKEKGFLEIKEVNYVSKKPIFINNMPQTTKANNKLHGFGIKSIEYIVHKYNGKASFKVVADKFYLNIIIPLEI